MQTRKSPIERSRDPWAWRHRARSGSASVRSKGRFGQRFAVLAAILILLVCSAVAAGNWGRASLYAPGVKEFVDFARVVVHGEPLTVEDLKARIAYDGIRASLVVEGNVVNGGHARLKAPTLTLGVRTPDNIQRYVWETRLGKAHLAPGERSPFTARLEAPPEGVDEVTVRLRDATGTGFGDPEGS